jgi:hypothetical protein
MEVAVGDTRRCCAGFHVHCAAAEDVRPVVEARPRPVLPVAAVVGGNGEDVHVAIHYDAGPGTLEAVEVTDDIGEMSLGAYGPG